MEIHYPTKSSFLLKALVVGVVGVGCWSCGGRCDPAPFFAPVKIPTITAQEAVEKGNLVYVRHFITQNVDEQGVASYFVERSFAREIKFLEDEYNPGVEIPVFCSTYDCGEYGLGVLNEDSLLVYNAEDLYLANSNQKLADLPPMFVEGRPYGIIYPLEKYFKAKVSNFAQFTTSWGTEGIEVYTEQGLWEEILTQTPKLTYTSEDGMSITLSLYKVPKFKDAKAIVEGEINDATPDFIKLYDEGFEGYISSVLTADGFFRAECEGEDFFAVGPRIKWEPDRLTVIGDPEKGIANIMLTRK